MGEFYEERRQEPRFSTAGRYRLQNRSSELTGRILDLSLNGALLERNESSGLQPGDRHTVSLEFAGHPAFHADVLLVRVDGSHLGIEFYDMDPENFAALSTLIHGLTRDQRQPGKSFNA
ncbi:MAG: PilZ domain-containing protein [Rudaea sp.]